MQVAQAILILGTVLLACGSASLLVVRIGSPRLRGVNLLSAAFATGALGSGLLLLPHSLVVPRTVGADLGLLLSFVLLHTAVLSMLQEKRIVFWHGGLLLGVQAVVDGLVLGHVLSLQGRVISLSLLTVLQSFSTAVILWRLARQRVRWPALFNASILTGFGLFNLARAGLVILLPSHRSLNANMALGSYTLFIALAIGLAFGFFWMTTSVLTDDLDYMASTDPLTRLYNRRVFLKWCEKELLRSQRTGVPFSILMVDLDHFKRVNDNFGHQTGDEVLCAAVERMQDSIRGIDVLCRWGGEEFAVLLPNAPAEATRIVAERIRLNIQKVTLSAARTRAEVAEAFQLTVSIGASTYRDLEDELNAVIQRADKALYEAKHTGRNRVLQAP